MKRFVKYLGLAGCLALCLGLSACYIAPDDINQDQLSTTVGGALTFQTLAPTATVEITPDVVAVETQNLFGTPTPRPAIGTTDAPGPTASPGWQGWEPVTEDTMTPQGESPTPDSSVIVFGPTATPSYEVPAVTEKATIQVVTAVPNTPTPTPGSLQVGFTGSDEVRALQKRLKELGYYTGSVDGDFGAGTEAAVRAFQKANGLTADGKAGKQTIAKLNSSSAISKKEADATATPKATAVKKGTPTPRPTATPNLSKEYYLQTGSSGAKVRTLQNRLIELGYLGGEATGEYDSATRRAVMAFQKKTRGLYDDGVAGPETLRILYSDGAARASSVAASTGATLEVGSKGPEVKALQQRLKDLGYYRGSVDGSFGASTENAVTAFQWASGLTADGKAGTATLNAIYADTAVRYGEGGRQGATATPKTTGTGRDTSGIGSTGYTTLETGSEGEAVRRVQQRLKELRYYNGSVDGRYGEGTAAAVMAFQLRNHLTVDGKAGPATQRALFGSSGAVSYSALREGESGPAVRTLQYTLYELGYYDGGIDGDYGGTTADAVRAFQIQNGLTPVDGVAGSATLARLYSADAIPASAAAVDYDTIRPGDSGEMVVELQDCLVQMGYLDEITGYYDDATVAAVRAFQRANGLTPDGVAGSRTLVLLFGY